MAKTERSNTSRRRREEIEATMAKLEENHTPQSSKERRRKRSSPNSTNGRPAWLAPFLLSAFLSLFLAAPVADFLFSNTKGIISSLDFSDSNLIRRRLANSDKRKAMEEGDETLEINLMPYKRMMAIPKYADKHHFDGCVGKTIEECQIIIDEVVQSMPDKFNNQTTLIMSIRKIREQTDLSYYKVVLRTNTAGTKVYGIYDDGVVYYPWPWKVNGEETDIGPWDCDEGDALSPEDCCAKIQADVPFPDDSGNYMACFVEEPVGGPNNPEKDNRAIVVTDGNGIVVRAPVAH